MAAFKLQPGLTSYRFLIFFCRYLLWVLRL